MPSLYILRLPYNRWYIGKTNNFILRKQQYMENRRIPQWVHKWAQIPSDIDVEKVIDNCDDFDEDKYTKIYMSKYGINNVRGGSYSTIHLPDYQLASLQKEFQTAKNNCFQCGKHGHYARECFNSICYTCGNLGHYSNECIH